MMSSRTAKVTTPADDQILITREFDAPKHLVYQVWMTPESIKRWWSGGLGPVTVAEVVNTVTFTERGGRTTLTMLVQAKDQATRDLVLQSGMEEGMQQGWDLVEELTVSLAEAAA